MYQTWRFKNSFSTAEFDEQSGRFKNQTFGESWTVSDVLGHLDDEKRMRTMAIKVSMSVLTLKKANLKVDDCFSVTASV